MLIWASAYLISTGTTVNVGGLWLLPLPRIFSFNLNDPLNLRQPVLRLTGEYLQVV